MKKTKFLLVLAILLLFNVVARSQNKPTDSTVSQVGVLYLVDSVSFKTATAWVTKITYYTKQYVQDPAADTASSFVVRKQSVPVGFKYFLKVAGKLEPVTVLAELYTPSKK